MGPRAASSLSAFRIPALFFSFFCCTRLALPLGSRALGHTAAPPLESDGPRPGGVDAADDWESDDRPTEDVSSDVARLDHARDDDPMALHHETPQSLRALMGSAALLALPVGGDPWQIGQGNRSISQHSVGRLACTERLDGLTLQTPEQLARCGALNMVPVWEGSGSIASARFCIDVFEFPNMACELPFVFVTPFQARAICDAQGKRLCAQEEWNLACRGDPGGGADRVYAYGDELDLGICNTNKARASSGTICNVATNDKVWTTCGTNTEPSGAFPLCRSRFGVFDQHGNVAEIMTRLEQADGEVKSQLKGSAFFYVEVAEKPTDPGGYWTKYPDHCNFDPRWHVENIETAAHSNYHLGFRCCKSLEPIAGTAGAQPDQAPRSRAKPTE